ncbi:MAG: YIP1 family protein [Chloroflexi bacterium]|nr:YIP1 family protein [Chloroflexota bacterium]
MISDRMLRAARLEASVFEEVEADTTATQQAAVVVLIAAVAAGIGVLLRGGGFGALIGAIITAVIGWIIWSYLTYWIGTKFFNGTATPGELLRTIGFAQTPGVLRIFSFIPVLGGLINLVVFVWLLVAGVIAVRQALDISTGNAVATVIVGWLAYVILAIIVAGLLAVGSLF